MNIDHADALELAKTFQGVANRTGTIAAAYLDLREKAKASLDAKARNIDTVTPQSLEKEIEADAALREALGEGV